MQTTLRTVVDDEEGNADVRNEAPPRWLKPVNKVMVAVQKLGVSVGPSAVLTVPGRKSGQPRSTPR